MRLLCMNWVTNCLNVNFGMTAVDQVWQMKCISISFFFWKLWPSLSTTLIRQTAKMVKTSTHACCLVQQADQCTQSLIQKIVPKPDEVD